MTITEAIHELHQILLYKSQHLTPPEKEALYRALAILETIENALQEVSK